MKFKTPMQLRDRIILVHRDKHGKILNVRDSGWSENGITNAGMASVAGLILTDITEPDYDWVAIGTGSTAFDPAQTTLVTETHREAGTGTLVTTTQTDDTAQLVRLFSGYAGSENVSEAGAFNAASAGDMVCRQTFTAIPINWDNGDTLTVTVKIQVKQGA